MTTDDRPPISFEDLRHLFDLAVDTPLVCSGNFDTDDVDVLRRIAAHIGVDPEGITPDEFITQYPHRFKPRRVDEAPRQVGEYLDMWGNVLPNDRSGEGQYRMRQETPTETATRVAEERADGTCRAGTYGRRCARTADHDIHPA